MRTILFKGFHEDKNKTEKAYYNGEWHTGEWLYGDLSQHKSGKVFIKPHYKSATHSKEVAPETVCQYTGRDDKNGKKIFDGDVLKVYKYGDGFGTYFDPPKETGQNVLVYWDLCSWGWRNTDVECYWHFPDAWVHYKGEVIGNKFENPDLIYCI